MNTIRTNSGIQINPFASISDILSGTSFNDDREAQGHLQSLADAFHDISKTDEGQVLLCSMEGKQSKCLAQCLVCISGLATRIRTEVSFKDAVKVCFRLAKKITSNPWVGIRPCLGDYC